MNVLKSSQAQIDHEDQTENNAASVGVERSLPTDRRLRESIRFKPQPIHAQGRPQTTQGTKNGDNSIKNLTTPQASRLIAAHSDADIYEAIRAAKIATNNGVRQATIAGQMLLEKRQQLTSCHDGTKFVLDASPDPIFEEWLAKVCAEISRRTAYRWMQAASRVLCFLLERWCDEAPTHVELDGIKYLISYVLTAQESDCSPAMTKFKKAFEAFLADKTLSEALAAAIDGESDASRFTLAANGKIKGGARGENRRNYAHFVFRHFKALNHIQSRWDKLNMKQPGEQSKMTETLRATILGGPLKLHEKGRPVDFKPWSASFSKLMFDILKERLHSESH
jgi:hypothetical protein